MVKNLSVLPCLEVKIFWAQQTIETMKQNKMKRMHAQSPMLVLFHTTKTVGPKNQGPQNWVQKVWSKAAPGTLAHRLQRHTAYNTSLPTYSKIANRIWK